MTAQNPSRSAATTTGPTVPVAVLVTAIVVLALNLRGPIVAVSAVLAPLQAELGIGAGTAGLLTSLPVLCFGLATPLASALLARTGTARGVSISLVVLLVGIVVRSLDGLPGALAGTVLIGLGITVANVAVPVVIGQYLSRWSSTVLGVYTAALNVGTMITLSLTVLIADVVGWRVALLAWSGLVVVGLGVWWYATRAPVRVRATDGSADADRGGPPPAVDERLWWRRPVVWALTAGFSGQAFAYYGATAWLPLLLGDELGMAPAAAAASSSVFQIAALVGAFGVPVLLRACPPRAVVLIVALAWVTLPLGLLVAAPLWPVWCAVAGAAQGGGLVVVFALVVARSRGAVDGRRVSALVQGGGYAVAAAGPLVVGSVHEAAGGWTASLLVILAAIALFGIATAASAPRGRQVT